MYIYSILCHFLLKFYNITSNIVSSPIYNYICKNYSIIIYSYAYSNKKVAG